MRTLPEIEVWFGQVKAAYADQMVALNELKQNGREVSPEFELRLKAAYTFIKDIEWRIENIPTDLVSIVGQMYKAISLIGTPLPGVTFFFNSLVGNPSIVVGDGNGLPFATATIFGKVRLSVPAVNANDPIVVGDNDPRLTYSYDAYNNIIVGAAFDANGRLILTKLDDSTVETDQVVVRLDSAAAQVGSIWVTGGIRTNGQLTISNITDVGIKPRVAVMDANGVFYYRTLAEFATDITPTVILTPNRAVVTNAGGLLAASVTTNTEIGYVSGVTSSIQTQLNNKLSLDDARIAEWTAASDNSIISANVNKSETYTVNLNRLDESVLSFDIPQSYRHIQSANSTAWTITHNLGFRPSVTVIDLDGDVVNADINYNTINQLIITFSSAIKGEAYLN
jgi:hypothetical protein